MSDTPPTGPRPGQPVTVPPVDPLAAEIAYELRQAAARAQHRLRHAVRQMNENAQQAAQALGADTAPSGAVPARPGAPATASAAVRAADAYAAAVACAEKWRKVERTASWYRGQDTDAALVRAAAAEVGALLDALQAGSTLARERADRTCQRAGHDGELLFMKEAREALNRNEQQPLNSPGPSPSAARSW
ncbi:hypothetical protein [Streptomyces luteireticuli]|uniref:hypothetical protein n=1 Tax=Streptomyces luteireticuli TaxID=173858 RepID=UPI00355717DC